MWCLFSICFVFFFSSRRRHTRCALVTGVQTCALPIYSPVKEIALHADFIGVHRFNVIGSDVDEEGSSPIESAASKATRIRGVKQHVVARLDIEEIGRESCRERVCQYV